MPGNIVDSITTKVLFCRLFAMVSHALFNAVKLGKCFSSTGVGTQTITASEPFIASSGATTLILPFYFFIEIFNSGSSIGLMPWLIKSALFLSVSTP